ncbi:hypothetical protein ACH4NV_33695 [Streptomyces althioticus]|uniref:hypothetical protein n=1 Tax=Streptomyces althioticus TaxID=83380 RepID=UPI003794C4C7
MTPFFAIVVKALGTDDAACGSRRPQGAPARGDTEQDRTHHFGFVHHLDVETLAYQGTTLLPLETLESMVTVPCARPAAVPAPGPPSSSKDTGLYPRKSPGAGPEEVRSLQLKQ